MGASPGPFRTLLFGIAFSPSIRANVFETVRLAGFFGARLILLHVGKKTPKKEAHIQGLLEEIGADSERVTVEWKKGKPFPVLLEACERPEIDLLVLGAKQQENLYRFYIGSIARRLTRKVSCSVLLLIKPTVERVACRRIVVNGHEDPATPLSIDKALHVGQCLGARQVTIVEEVRPQEVAVKVVDDATLERAQQLREALTLREDARIGEILAAVPAERFTDLDIKTQSIFGIRGYSIGHYAQVVRADLLVLNAAEKSTFWDRLFPHDTETILSDLPTDLLIVRPLKTPVDG